MFLISIYFAPSKLEIALLLAGFGDLAILEHVDEDLSDSFLRTVFLDVYFSN